MPGARISINRSELYARVAGILDGMHCPEGSIPDVVVSDGSTELPPGIPGILIWQGEEPPEASNAWHEVLPEVWLGMLRERVLRYMPGVSAFPAGHGSVSPWTNSERGSGPSPDLTFTVQLYPHIRVTAISARAADLFGYTEEAFRNDSRLVLRLMDSAHRRLFLQRLRTPSFYSGTHVVTARTRRGEAITVEAVIKPILGLAGKIEGAEGVLRLVSGGKLDGPLLEDDVDRFRFVLEGIDQGVLITDASGRPLFHNRCLREMTGRSTEEWQGEKFPERLFLEPEASETQGSSSVVRTMASRSGTSRKVRVAQYRFRSGYSELTLSLFSDVTREMEMAGMLRMQSDRLRLMLHHLPILVWQMDLNGYLMDIDGSLLDRVAILPDRFLGHRITRFLASRVEWNGIRERLVLGQSETIWKKISGITIRIHLQAITDEDGRPCGIMGLGMDISDVIKVFDAMHRQKGFFESLFDQLPVGVYTLNPLRDFVGTMVNRRGAELLGIDPDRPEMNQYPLQEDLDHLADLFKRGEGTIRLERIRHDGTGKQCLKILMVPVRTGEESPVLLGIVEDVSEQRLYEEQIMQAREEAEEANAHKSHFLAQMGHEIRTPLNAIVGFTEILLSKMDATHPLREYVRSIQTSGRNLTTLLNDVLDYSRAESGSLEVRTEVVDLCRVLHDVENTISGRLSDRHLQIHLKMSEDVPSHVYLDEVRLREILVNLAVEAMPFVSSDRMEIAVLRERGSTEEGWVSLTFQINDAGARDIPARGEGGLHRNRDMRIGLSIAERLARLIGGAVEILSSDSAGGLIRLNFPYLSVAASEGTTAKSAVMEQLSDIRFGGARVLIVEDDDANRHVMLEFLRGVDLNVSEAQDGLTAMDRIRAAPFDLILLDVHLPGMDGREVASRMRQLFPGKELPILALTGEPGFSSEDFNATLQKPFTRDELLLLLARFLPFGITPASGDARVPEEVWPSDIRLDDGAERERLQLRVREARSSLNLNDIRDLERELRGLAEKDASGGALSMANLLADGIATVSVGRLIQLLDHLMACLEVRSGSGVDGRE